MFLRAYVELTLRAADVEEVLLRSPERWIPSLATSADERGDRLLGEAGFPVAGHHVGKRVEIALGQPVRTLGRTWLPISWRPTAPRGLFPALDGELEVAPLGPRLTQLGLSARYKPPFGLVGESLNRVLLHRVAEATIRDFVERVGSRVQEEVA